MKKWTTAIISTLYLFPLTVLAESTATTHVSLTNPLATDDVRVIIGQIIKAALGLSGTIALVMVIWGGFLWLTSQGNTEKIEKGRNVLLWATIGLIIIFFAYTIVNTVIGLITDSSATT